MLDNTNQLAELMAQKHELLTQLCALGKRQLELINGNELALLMRVLSAKQNVLSTLHEVQRALDPYREQSPDARRWSSAAAREQCAQLAAHCDQLLVEVVRLEKQSESQLVLRRDDAAERLQGVHAAAFARGAYAADNVPVISQLDLSSGN